MDLSACRSASCWGVSAEIPHKTPRKPWFVNVAALVARGMLDLSLPGLPH